MSVWLNRFRVAFCGVGFAFKDQVSFWVHLPCAAIIITLAAWMRLQAWQWAIVVTAIALVLVAEMLNSAIELLVKALHPNPHPLIGRALDVSAGGVLLAAITAAILGAIALGPGLVSLFAS